LCGKKQGYLTQLAQQHRVHLLAEDINPISLLQNVNKVYCVTSQMGFEALLCGKPLTTFGLPWYAGWGVSDDRHPKIGSLVQTQRRAPRSLLQLFAAAYLQYSRYLNPNTGEAGSLFDVIDYLATVKRKNDKLRGELYCVGMSLWKRAVAKPFFNVPSCRLKFISSTQKLAGVKLSDDARILAWGNGKEAIVRFAEQHHIPLLRVEDNMESIGRAINSALQLSKRGGGVALMLGLGTRFFALALLVVTIVATAAVHWPAEWHSLAELAQGYVITDDGHGNFKLPLIFMVMLWPLMFFGAGRISLDALLGVMLRRQRH